MTAIVYTSNSGFTAKYAEMLSSSTGYKAYTLKDAERTLTEKSEIVFLGWLMAGKISGYSRAVKRFRPVIVCAVGMAHPDDKYSKELAANNAIKKETAFFYLQGGFDMNRLHGMSRFMMKCMSQTVGKKLSAKQDRTPDEDEMLELFTHGGDRTSVESLSGVIEKINEITQNK